MLKQAHSLRAHVSQFQTPWDRKEGKKNQNYYKWGKTKESFKIHMKAKISGEDLMKSWFCKIKYIEKKLQISHLPGPLLPSHEGVC